MNLRRKRGGWINTKKSKTTLPSKIHSKKTVKSEREVQMEADLKNFNNAIKNLEKSRRYLKKCINKLMNLKILKANDISHILNLNDQLTESIDKLKVNLNKKIGEVWDESY